MEKTYKVLKIVILVLVLVVLILGATRLYNTLSSQVQMDVLATQPKSTEPEQTGTGQEQTQPQRQAAPDFTVYDLEGNAHKLSDYQGKPVILNFWASWCGPCKMEMPDFDEKYLEYGEELHFLMVNLTDGNQETVESASSYVADAGYSFPVYYDTDIEGAMKYGVNSVPVTYFIDAEGYLVTWGRGALSADLLQKGIDMLIDP